MSRIKPRLRRREKNVLDMPLYRSGVYTNYHLRRLSRADEGLPYVERASHQRRSATTDQIPSTIPNGQAPCRKP